MALVWVFPQREQKKGGLDYGLGFPGLYSGCDTRDPSTCWMIYSMVSNTGLDWLGFNALLSIT